MIVVRTNGKCFPFQFDYEILRHDTTWCALQAHYIGDQMLRAHPGILSELDDRFGLVPVERSGERTTLVSRDDYRTLGSGDYNKSRWIAEIHRQFPGRALTALYYGL